MTGVLGLNQLAYWEEAEIGKEEKMVWRQAGSKLPAAPYTRVGMEYAGNRETGETKRQGQVRESMGLGEEGA